MKDDIADSNNLANIYKFFTQFKPINFKKGEIIYRSDLPTTNVFYIEKGYVKTYTLSQNGDEKIILFLESHHIFPLKDVIKTNTSNFFSEAMVNTTIRCVNEKEFEKFLDNNKVAMREYVNYILKCVEIYSHRIENLGYMTSCPRVIYSLLSLVNRFGTTNKSNIDVEIPITQQELAATLAMTRETFSRELEKLVKENIVGIKDKTIIIKDVNKLISRLDDYGENNL